MGDVKQWIELGGQRYGLIERVGAGGEGRLYRGVNDEGIAVAIKDLHHVDPRDRAQLERKLALWARLGQVDTIPQLHVAGEAGLGFYIVSDWIEGQNVRERVAVQRYSEIDAIDFLQQACYGLRPVHDARVVHRDVSPNNVMVTPTGRVMYTDLGTLRAMDGTAGTAFASRDFATLGYTAPEVLSGVERVTPAADIYGLGGVVWYLLTEEDPKPPLHQAMGRQWLRFDDLLEHGVSPEFIGILRRMRAEEVGERYQSVDDVLHDLGVNTVYVPMPGDSSGGDRRDDIEDEVGAALDVLLEASAVDAAVPVVVEASIPLTHNSYVELSYLQRVVHLLEQGHAVDVALLEAKDKSGIPTSRKIYRFEDEGVQNYEDHMEAQLADLDDILYSNFSIGAGTVGAIGVLTAMFGLDTLDYVLHPILQVATIIGGAAVGGLVGAAVQNGVNKLLNRRYQLLVAAQERRRRLLDGFTYDNGDWTLTVVDGEEQWGPSGQHPVNSYRDNKLVYGSDLRNRSEAVRRFIEWKLDNQIPQRQEQYITERILLERQLESLDTRLVDEDAPTPIGEATPSLIAGAAVGALLGYVYSHVADAGPSWFLTGRGAIVGLLPVIMYHTALKHLPRKVKEAYRRLRHGSAEATLEGKVDAPQESEGTHPSTLLFGVLTGASAVATMVAGGLEYHLTGTITPATPATGVALGGLVSLGVTYVAFLEATENPIVAARLLSYAATHPFRWMYQRLRGNTAESRAGQQRSDEAVDTPALDDHAAFVDALEREGVPFDEALAEATHLEGLGHSLDPQQSRAFLEAKAKQKT